MARRKTLSDTGVAKLKVKDKRYTEPDPDLRGHYVRVTPNGAKSFVAVARAPAGKQVWATIGSADVLKIDEAREKARGAILRIKAGLEPFEPPPRRLDSFKAVADNYLDRHVRAKCLRSRSEIERILDRYVLPRWRDVPFEEIRRSDVTRLLDEIEDGSGPRQADYALAVVRGIMNWHVSRTDDYASPIARGMGRVDPKSRKRARILDDDEIRMVWKVAETNGTFGAILRLLLVTAQRREKVASLRWEDVSVDGVWNIPAEDREKGTGGALVLPEAALEIIRSQNRIGDNPHVFAGRGGGHFNRFSPYKRAFDAKLATCRGEPMPAWVVHDLRRTARSLMSRAGVRPDIAESVMGHVIAGVEGVYDRHKYFDEKADALAKLAGLIERIVNSVENVVPIAQNTEQLPSGG